MKYALTIFTTYLVAWTVSYVLIVGVDFRYYFEYLRLAWTFTGLELPSYTWFLSVVLFVPLAVGAVVWLRRRDRHKVVAA